MCVIFFKPAGVALPKILDMKKMYWDNSDGLGFMQIKEEHVVGQKFHTLDAFLEAIYKVPRKLVVIGHFRTATHGGRGIEYAQPFPFPVKEKSELYTISWEASLGVAHNGIISGFGDSIYGETPFNYVGDDGKTRTWKGGKWEEASTVSSTEPKLSDTQDFLWYLSKVKSLSRAISVQDDAVLALIRKLVTSKWAFLNKRGKVRIIGSWLTVNGVLYSNLFWQTKTELAKTNVYNNFHRGSGHYPTQLTLPPVTEAETPIQEMSMEIDSKQQLCNEKLVAAKKHCSNWTFCTQNGKFLHGCMVKSDDHCVYFDSAVAPIIRRITHAK